MTGVPPPDRSGAPAPGRLSRHNVRHGLAMLCYGSNPAATVYDSLGPDFFLALDEGWLNLGLWEGDGADPAEAPLAVRRLVRRVADALPHGGDLLDVGNGLGAQDAVIAEMAAPASLTVLNITRSQLVAGRDRLREAGAAPVNGDACRMPFRAASFDGLISVEAAFHFPSRRRFFEEAHRVLRPGGVLTMSDIPVRRRPHGPRELVAALSQLRAWGLRRTVAATPVQLEALARDAGFTDVRLVLDGERVIGPALRFVRGRLAAGPLAARSLAARAMLTQMELLWARRVIDYAFLTGRKP